MGSVEREMDRSNNKENGRKSKSAEDDDASESGTKTGRKSKASVRSAASSQDNMSYYTADDGRSKHSQDDEEDEEDEREDTRSQRTSNASKKGEKRNNSESRKSKKMNDSDNEMTQSYSKSERDPKYDSQYDDDDSEEYSPPPKSNRKKKEDAPVTSRRGSKDSPVTSRRGSKESAQQEESSAKKKSVIPINAETKSSGRPAHIEGPATQQLLRLSTTKCKTIKIFDPENNEEVDCICKTEGPKCSETPSPDQPILALNTQADHGVYGTGRVRYPCNLPKCLESSQQSNEQKDNTGGYGGNAQRDNMGGYGGNAQRDNMGGYGGNRSSVVDRCKPNSGKPPMQTRFAGNRMSQQYNTPQQNNTRMPATANNRQSAIPQRATRMEANYYTMHCEKRNLLLSMLNECTKLLECPSTPRQCTSESRLNTHSPPRPSALCSSPRTRRCELRCAYGGYNNCASAMPKGDESNIVQVKFGHGPECKAKSKSTPAAYLRNDMIPGNKNCNVDAPTSDVKVIKFNRRYCCKSLKLNESATSNLVHHNMSKSPQNFAVLQPRRKVITDEKRPEVVSRESLRRECVHLSQYKSEHTDTESYIKLENSKCRTQKQSPQTIDLTMSPIKGECYSDTGTISTKSSPEEKGKKYRKYKIFFGSKQSNDMIYSKATLIASQNDGDPCGCNKEAHVQESRSDIFSGVRIKCKSGSESDKRISSASSHEEISIRGLEKRIGEQVQTVIVKTKALKRDIAKLKKFKEQNKIVDGKINRNDD